MNSRLESILSFIATSEIPALYYMVERFSFLAGLIFFASGFFSIYRVKAITGNYSMAAMNASESSIQSVLAQFTASVFLASFGVGQAVISNTLYFHTVDPYSIEMLRSISCAAGDAAGCIHYELGMFQDGSWSKASINQTFFELVTATIAIFGTIVYAVGWFNFGRLGAASPGRQPRTFGQCSIQIIFGSLMMRPVDSWLMLTGG